jgi:hypothetical protein
LMKFISFVMMKKHLKLWKKISNICFLEKSIGKNTFILFRKKHWQK